MKTLEATRYDESHIEGRFFRPRPQHDPSFNVKVYEAHAGQEAEESSPAGVSHRTAVL